MALFYELLRVALGNQETLSETPSDSEWRSIYRAAQKQTVVGFAFEALERLHNKGIRPPQDILYEWIGSCEQIKKQNKIGFVSPERRNEAPVCCTTVENVI